MKYFEFWLLQLVFQINHAALFRNVPIIGTQHIFHGDQLVCIAFVCYLAALYLLRYQLDTNNACKG